MSQSSSKKSNTQNSSNSQSSIEIEIPTLKLDSQPCCLSQNTEQPISLETTSTSQSEIITSTSVEKLTESLIGIDSEKKLNVLSEEENESASVILKSISLETSSSQSETSTKMDILSESPKEIDTKKDLCDLSEELQRSESTLVTSEPISLATSSCRSETITITKSKGSSESPKEIDTVKNLGGLSKEVQEIESESFTLQSILATSSTSQSKKRTKSKKVVFSESLKESDTEKKLGGSFEGQESESLTMNSQPFSLGASSMSQSTLIEKLTESLKQIDINKDAPSQVVLEGLAARLGEYLESIKITLANSSTSQSEKRTSNEKEVLSEPLKEINTEQNLDGPSEDQKSEYSSTMTSQPLSLAASSASQSEIITNPPIEKLTESFKQIDINKVTPSEEVLEGLAARLTLDGYLESKNSLAASSTSQSEKRTNSKRGVLSESLTEINTEKNLICSSGVRKKEASKTSQPLSLAASSKSQSETITNSSVEKLTESLKQININKELEASSEDVPERLPAKMTLKAYLESIEISALISTRHFLIKRSPHLKKLIDEAVKLQKFMEYVNKLRHEFQPCQHTSLSCLTMIPKEWHKFTKDWEIFMRQIVSLIETTTVIMQQCAENSTNLREEFVTYLDNLLAISEDLGELEEICDHALNIYRSVCFNFDNYFFLLHISTVSANMKALQERVMQECGKLSSFEEEIERQIKQAESQIDGLL